MPARSPDRRSLLKSECSPALLDHAVIGGLLPHNALFSHNLSFRGEVVSNRQAEINKKRELSALADIKRLEIMTAERLQHRGTLANFIRTAATPPLHWLPAAHNEATEQLLDQQQDKLAEWKVGAVPEASAASCVPLDRLIRFVVRGLSCLTERQYRLIDCSMLVLRPACLHSCIVHSVVGACLQEMLSLGPAGARAAAAGCGAEAHPVAAGAAPAGAAGGRRSRQRRHRCSRGKASLLRFHNDVRMMCM